MKTVLFSIIVSGILLISACSSNSISKIDLSGEWQFQIDSDYRGLQEKWHENELQEAVNLPGSMVENGKGFDITLETKWTGHIYNTDWYKDPKYAKFDLGNNW